MFNLVLGYIFLEYARPQESIPFIGLLHLPAIVTLILAVTLVWSANPALLDRQAKLFILFLAVMLFHVPIARNNYWALHIARVMAVTFVAYLGLVTSVDTLKKFRILIAVWLGTHVYLAVNGILHNGQGIGGFLQDENDFGMTLNMVLPFTFFLAVSAATAVRKVVYLSMAALFLVANMTTLSRGGFIGLVAVALYCWMRSPRKVASALLIGLLWICIVPFAPSNYWKEVESISEDGASKGTGEVRVYLWQVGWHMFLDNPIIGVGQGNFPFRFRAYEIASGFEEGLDRRSWAGHVAHSVYVTLAAEHGLVGITVLVMMLYCFRKDILLIRNVATSRLRGSAAGRAREALCLSFALGGAMVGFLVSGVFISILYYPNLWLLLGLTVAFRNAVVGDLASSGVELPDTGRGGEWWRRGGAAPTHGSPFQHAATT